MSIYKIRGSRLRGFLAACLVWTGLGATQALAQAPVADAGDDVQVVPGQMVRLDASGTDFGDATELTFAWSILGDGAGAQLVDASGPVAQLRLDTADAVEVELSVTDNNGRTSTDSVIATTARTAPVADAGPDRAIEVGKAVVLDAGASRNPSGLPVDYSWELTQVPEGSLAALDEPTALRPSFTPDVAGTYTASLTAQGRFTPDASTDIISLSTEGTSPRAHAGPDRTATVGTTVTFDPKGTIDSDGDSLEAEWVLLSKPSGSVATLESQSGGRNEITPDVAGEYLVGLAVSDGSMTDYDTVVVLVGTATNTAPIANAGSDVELAGLAVVRLDGTGSTDAQGDRLTYSWSVLSAPVTSFAIVEDPAAPLTNFVPDLAGTYQLQLTVTDEAGLVDRDTVILDTRPSQAHPRAGNEGEIRDRLASVDGLASTSDAAATYKWSALDLGAVAASVEQPEQLLTNVTFETSAGVFDDRKVDAGLDVLQDYNLFVAKTHYSRSHVGGRAAIAGRSKGGWSSYGYQLGDTTDQDILTVGGGIYGGSRKAHGGGDIRVNGSVRAATRFHHGGRLIHDRSVELWDEVEAVRHLSDALCDLPATGDYEWQGDRRHRTIRLPAEPDANGVAVFHFENGSSLLDNWAVRKINLEANGAKTIIINVAGSHLYMRKPTLGGDFLDPAISKRVIWNFHSARLLHVKQAFEGSLLAPRAQVQIWSPVRGSVAVGSVLQYTTIKLPTYNGEGLIGEGDTDPNLALLQLSGDNGLGLAPNFDTVLLSTGNLRPVARITSSVDQGQTVEPGTTVVLDASQSRDDAAGALAYRWSVLSAPAGSVADVDLNASRLNFNVSSPGAYVFQLAVSDGALTSEPSTFAFTVENQPPVADAGPDQSGFKGETVMFDGSASSDPEGESLSYSWLVAEAPGASTAILTGADTATPTLTPEVPGVYRLSLTVSDGSSESAAAFVSYTAENRIPTAVITGPNTGSARDMIALSGAQSTDADGDALSYGWTITGPDGSAVALGASDTVDIMFTPELGGTYLARLIVGDGFDNSAPADFAIEIDSSNRAPVLGAVAPQTVAFGDVLSLQLSATDPDSDPLRYFVNELPLPSGASFSAETGLLVYRPASAGSTTTLTLGVSDGELSDSQSVTFTVTDDNASETTTFSGTVVDGATGAGVAGVQVMVGTQTAVTDAQGRFTLADLEAGAANVWVVTTPDTQLSPDGSRYGATQARVQLYAGVINRTGEPIRLSTITGSGRINGDDIVTVEGGAFGLRLDIPADAVTDTATGEPYRGPLSIASISPEQANALPPDIVPCQLFTVEPKTLVISQPVSLSLENYDDLPAGAVVDVWVFADGRFARRGTGTVTADATQVTATLSDIPGGAMIALSPRPSTVSVAVDQPRQTYVPSLLGEGNYSTTLSPPGYASLGADRGVSFVYNSTAAAPSPIVSASVTLGGTVPEALTARIEIGGVDYGLDALVTAGADVEARDTIRQTVQIEASNLPTGANRYRFVSVSQYACSRVGQATEGTVLFDNQSDSPFGAGWSMAELTRLYPQEDGSVVIREGDGTLKDFEPLTDFGTLGDPVRLPAVGPFTGQLFDLDGDGDRDIAWIVPESGGIALYENLGDRQFAERGVLEAGRVVDVPGIGSFTPDVTQIAIGDLDADGTLDIIAGTQLSDQVFVFYGQAGGFAYDPALAAINRDLRGLVATDYNNDGDADLIGFTASALRPYYYSGNPSRTFNELRLDGATARTLEAITTDYNGDGLVDIVTRRSDRIVTYRGRDGLTPIRDLTIESPLFTQLGGGLAAEDLDGDGSLEFIATSGQSGFVIAARQANGTYAVVRTVDTQDKPLGNRPFAVADLNRDGRADIIVPRGSELVTFFGSVEGWVGDPEIIDVGFPAQDPRLADLDGDGSVDIVVDDATLDEIFVYFSDPSRTSKFFDPLGDYTELTRNADGSYSRRFKDGTTLAYNADGLQTSVTDSNGNVTAYDYDDAGRLTRITDPVGEVTTFAYTALGKMTRATYPDGRSASWEYSETGALIRWTDVNGDTTLLGYDASNRLTAKTDPRGLVSEVQYGPAGRMSGTTLPDGTELQLDIARSLGLSALSGGEATPDAAGTSRIADGRGNITVTEINEFGSPTKVTDPLGRVTTYTRDGANNVIAIDAPSSVTPDNRLRTEIDYDERGNVLAKREAVGTPLERVMTYEYEPVFSKMTAMVDADGFRTERTYDAFGNMLTETDPEGGVFTMTYDERGLPSSRTDKNGNLTRLDYSERGLPVTVTDPSNVQVEYRYDDAGNLVSRIDDFGGTLSRETTYTYDDKNRMLTEVAADGGVTAYVYDGNGNVLSTTDPTGVVERRTYDERDRLLTVEDPASGTSTLTYDADSNVVRMADALGAVTEFEYDAVDRLLSSVDARGQLRAFGYDLRDNITAVTDARANITRMQYDALDRPVGRVNPLGQAWNFAYDLRDNRVSATKPDGTVITSRYDGLSRLVGLSGGDVTRDFSYDAQSNLLAANDRLDAVDAVGGEIGLAFSYDRENRLEAASVSGLFAPGTLANRFDYQYDALDRRSVLTDSFGGNTAYAYDPVDRLAALTTPQGEVFASTYDLAGRMLTRSSPNVVETVRSFETDTGRLATQRHALLGADVNAYDYVYTDRGNIAAIVETGQVGRAKAYTYDALERLTEVDVPDAPEQDESYTLDPEGNRISSQLSSTHSTNAANRLTEDDRYAYVYDLNGNLTGKLPKAGASDVDGTALSEWAYAYDALDQLVSVARDGAVVERYRYDAFGRRSLIETANDNDVDGTQPTTPLGLANDGSDRTLDLAPGPLGSASLLRRYTHGQSVDEPLQMEVFDNDGTGGRTRLETYTYHADHLGSIRALTDSAGNVSHAYDYDSYGRLLAEAEPTLAATANPFRYTGREWDAASQLYHYRARGYDAEIGTFLQDDPICYKSGDFNIRRYVGNNPVNTVDPSGLVAAVSTGNQNGQATDPRRLEAKRAIGCAINNVMSIAASAIAAAGTDVSIVGIQKVTQCASIVLVVARETSSPESEDDCDAEWNDAYEECEKLLASPNPPWGLTGGYSSIGDCARGLVSENCGGNPVDHGKNN